MEAQFNGIATDRQKRQQKFSDQEIDEVSPKAEILQGPNSTPTIPIWNSNS